MPGLLNLPEMLQATPMPSLPLPGLAPLSHGGWDPAGTGQPPSRPTPDQLVRFITGNMAVEPAPPPAVAPPVRPQFLSYNIKRGDTLWALARRFGTTIDELAAANGISDPNKIRAGANLQIPLPPPPPDLAPPPARPDPGPPVARPAGLLAGLGGPGGLLNG